MENLKCSVCSLQDFHSASELHEHEDWCRNGIYHICKACNKSYSTTAELSSHVLQHVQEQPSLCPYCNRGVLKHGFEQHIQKHHGVKPGKNISRTPLIEAFDLQTAFIVTENPDEIAPAGSFESLMDYCRVSRKNEKPVEPVASSSSEGEQDSEAERGPRPGRYPCEHCGIVFTKLSHEIKHKKVHLSARPFKCPYCEKMFTADRGVKKHIFRLHPEHSEQAWNVKTPESNSNTDCFVDFRPFLCLLCKRVFRRKATIREHVAVMHIGQTMRFPFVRRSPHAVGLLCAICHQGFTLEEMQGHGCPGRSMIDKMGKEIMQNAYPCSKCAASFTRKDNLRAHIQKMHNEQPVKVKKEHICEVCGAKFPKQSRLQEHSLVHSNARPYACVYCKKALKSKRSLRSHLLTLHKLNVSDVDKMVNELPDLPCEFADDSSESAKKPHSSSANTCESCPICQKDEIKEEGSPLDYDYLREHIRDTHVPSAPAPSAPMNS